MFAHDWNDEGQRERFQCAIELFEKACRFPKRVGLNEGAIAERIYRATDGVMGNLCRLFERALKLGIEQGVDVIDEKLLAEASGVERMVFERADAEKAIAMISEIDRPQDVSIDGAAKILDMRTPLIHGLIDANILPLISRSSRACRLDFDAVSSFWNRYETAQRIARRNRTKSAIIEEKLHAIGVKPIAVAKVDGRRDVPIYRKNDVEQVELR